MSGKHLKPAPASKLGACAIAAVLSFLPPGASLASFPDGESAQTMNHGVEAPRRHGSDMAAQSDIDRRFNDLRRELLDDRSKLVDWWMTIPAIFLALIGIAGFGGYVSFRRFREIEAEARESADKVRENTDKSQQYAVESHMHLEQIREIRNAAHSMLENVNAEIAKKEPDKARDIAQKVVENPTASPLDKAVSAAIILQNQGRIDEALEKWRAIALVMQGDKSDLECRAWFSVGYLLQERRPPDMRGAVDAYDKAIEIDPADAAAYNNRGNAKTDLGQHEDAIKDFDNAISLKPDYVEPYNNRGVAKAGLGQFQDAINDFGEAISLKPDYSAAYSNRGSAKAELGQYQDAIEDFDRAILLDPDSAEAYSNRGNAKSALGRPQEAISDYDEAIRLKPDYFIAYVNRGSANANLGQHREAITDYGEAIRLKPDYAEAYNNRGDEYNKIGRTQEARSDFERALELAQVARNHDLATMAESRLNSIR